MLQVVRSFTFDGESFTAGTTRVAPDHPAVRGREDHFIAVDPYIGRSERSVEDRVRQLAERPENREDGAHFGHGRPRSTDRGPGGEARDLALRAIESRSGELSPAAGDRLTALVERDRFGADARYIAAVSSGAYERAFAKKLTAASGAGVALDPEEGEAMLAVERSMLERSMIAGDGPSGGYAVPFALDPSIQLSSDGSLNPVREVATVTSITVTEWRGVTSEGVVAEFAQEGAEVADGTPTLVQPAIKPERAHAWVEFSIELGQDWPSLAQELATLFSDAKDNLEATKFIAGTGSDEPQGLLYGLTNLGSGDPDVAVPTDGEAITASDVYRLQESLPSRWQPRARFMSSLTTANGVHRLSGPGSDEPPLFNENRDRLLAKPWHEISTIPSTIAPGATPLVYGDVRSAFRIVDRIGMTIELVPHTFGAQGRPVGMRGFYAIWRTGSAVQIPNAARLLEITAGGSGSGSGSGA